MFTNLSYEKLVPRFPTDLFRLPLAVFALLLPFSQPASALCGDEVSRARQTAERIDQEWPVRTIGDTVGVYLQHLGERLAPRQEILAVGRYFSWDWPQQWQFRAVRDTSANAFSTGNGRTYVTDGVLLAAQREEQVAAILAHEMSHQLAGHFCGNNDGPAPGRMVGSLSQAMDIQKEMEADRLAWDILAAAGYPAQAMLDAVAKMPSSDPRSRQQRIQVRAYPFFHMVAQW
ncbi:MAG: hypothetical protein EPN23_11355 [Verrucomicrobia bacterium]|nr:MAG: hypothetical protein EPN23_11355 [Verrucomicrobiota bacterium]